MGYHGLESAGCISLTHTFQFSPYCKWMLFPAPRNFRQLAGLRWRAAICTNLVSDCGTRVQCPWICCHPTHTSCAHLESPYIPADGQRPIFGETAEHANHSAYIHAITTRDKINLLEDILPSHYYHVEHFVQILLLPSSQIRCNRACRYDSSSSHGMRQWRSL
jgi:hypothetical protein